MPILLTVLSVSLITTTLAVLVVISDRFLNNYGECQLDINDGDRVLTVTGGSSLLSSLALNKIFIPSACGGKATCGLCKVKLASESGPVLPTEEPYLTDEEMAEGIRLSCQLKVKENLTLFIPEELFRVQQFKATVTKITQQTHDIMEYRLSLVDPSEIEFKAGQYMQIDSKPYGSIRESVNRAYSIASLPSDNNGIELIVRLVPGGVCTTYMHEHLKEGDSVTIRGPFGDFYLHDGADELIFIAGGSGLAPIKSMVFDILEKKLDKKMTFFFGAVTKKDLYYVDLFTELAEKHDNFHYVPALSGPEEFDDWQGEVGLVTDVVDRYVQDAANMQGYLCGSPGMINACIKVLVKLGLSEDRIYFDKF